MVKKFKFQGGGTLIFGEGEFSSLSSLTDISRNALICGHSFQKTEYYREISGSFYAEFLVRGEPEADEIDRITSRLKGNIDGIVAVGGGSILDRGKAVAAMCLAEGSVEDYLEGVGTKEATGKTLPLIAVPTTAGTGSEATMNAVISRKGVYKKSLRHKNYIPYIALIDPLLYETCPLETRGFCGLDAFSQLLESYLSTKGNRMTELLSLEGISLFAEHFIPFLEGKNSIETLSAIAYGAYLSGITLANAGLGTVHGIAGPLGAIHSIPHGAACAILLPRVMEKTNYKLIENEEFQNKMKKLNKTLGETCNMEKEKDPLFTLLDRWNELLNMPGLAHFGIEEKDLPSLSRVSGNKNNPYPFSSDEILKILREGL